MKFESHAEERLVRPMERAVDAAVDDVVAMAKALARKRTGTFAASITRTPLTRIGDRFEARVGSPLSSAKAKEEGAYITAKRDIPKFGQYLAVPAGDGTLRKVKAVRLAPRPAVKPAGARFTELLTARLRQFAR